MKRIAMIAAVLTLAACNPAAPPSTAVERVARGPGNYDIEVYEMKDGVRCYVYLNRGIACVRVAA